MFDKEYTFKGIHAEKVKKLTSKFNDDISSLFSRNMDVYILAPIIGFLYQKKSQLDQGNETTKIFVDVMIKEQSTLKFIYNLIILLDEKHEKEFEKRCDKAFRNFGTQQSKKDEELFEEYVRGGVEILYEKLLGDITNIDSYLINLYELIDEINTRYNDKITMDSLIDLCKLASD